MTTSMSACGKANAFGSLKGILQVSGQHHGTVRSFSGNRRSADRPEERAAQRELLVNVLGANATRRDAKQYLARFEPPPRKSATDQFKRALQESQNANHRDAQTRLDRSGINLGGLYAPARAIAESPQFFQDQQVDRKTGAAVDSPLHIALACLRDPEQIDDHTMDGLAVTLSQLVKLDMQIVLVLDCQSSINGSGEKHALSVKELRRAFVQQCDRLRKAIGKHNPSGARSILGAMEVADSSHKAHQQLTVPVPGLIMDPLKRGIVTMIPTLAYTPAGQLTTVDAEDVMVALLRTLSGMENTDGQTHDMYSSVDRIIVLDQLGGIPSKVRGDEAHVFVNLEQEYEDIRDELAAEYSDLTHAPAQQSSSYLRHQSNLGITQKCLALLPPSSSALIIAPEEAASAYMDSRKSNIGTGTRRQRNTLIHNLLTNKPMVSSSLPVARLSSSAHGHPDSDRIISPTATLVRRGMPLTIIPAVEKGHGWTPPSPGAATIITADGGPLSSSPLRLEDDPRVDFPRLLHLIESSFRRKLDVPAYLSRVAGRIAGIIVAGEYEGGAILTWEEPPSVQAEIHKDGITDGLRRSATTLPRRLVPYLDKFAVHPSSQGSSGVADIVFQAMLRTCFPHGVCWRSRKTNPANKWYFERAVGTWRIPESEWTMFWTGEGVVVGEQRWADYVGVCRNIQPTWAD